VDEIRVTDWIRRFGACAWLTVAVARSVAAAPTSPAAPDLRLVVAAQEGDVRQVRALIAARVDVNTPRPDGTTPLMWAAHRDDLEMTTLLLEAGATVDATDEQGVSPLALAAENGSVTLVNRLLSAGAAARRAQVNGVTPLMIAARVGSVPVVSALLAAGADPSTAIPSTGQTALMWATAERHHEVVRALLAGGANVRAASAIGFTPLLFAARNGDLDTASVLVEAGADVNQIGSDGTHPLPLAIVSGHAAFAKYLIAKGANVNGTMHGVSALHAAAGKVDVWIRDWLRARRASVDARSTAGLPSSERVELTKLLLARGADVNARTSVSTFVGLGISGRYGARDPISTHVGDLKGATPLWVAAYWANGAGPDAAAAAQVMRVLLAAGANHSLTTADGTTPLMAAAGLGHGSYQPGAERGARSVSAEAGVAALVEAGADVNATNEGQFTALHGAAFRGLNEVVEYLAQHGARLNAQDFRGRTAFRIAQGAQQGFRVQPWPSTAALIEKLGADTTIGVDGATDERERARALVPAGSRP
jgi:ankyrin repeat protein